MPFALQPKWPEVTVRRNNFQYPNLCPGCLRDEPSSLVQVVCERGRMTAFYIVGSRWQNLYIKVPFCPACAKRRKHWERLDSVLLFLAAITALVLGFGITAVLNLPSWTGWVLFGVFAAGFTYLCSRFGTAQRAVRVIRFDESTITFSFKHSAYALDFGLLNGQAEQLRDLSART